MNILKENIGQLNDIISLEVQATDYKEKVENTLKDLRRKANIPGFRVGHVPMGMINKMYRKSVLADEITKIVQDNLLNYIKENNINILFEPLPLPEKTQGDFDKEDGNFTFFFEIGLQPEFEIDYEKTKKIKYLKISANEKDIEEEIKKMRHKMGKFSSTEVVADEDIPGFRNDFPTVPWGVPALFDLISYQEQSRGLSFFNPELDVFVCIGKVV